MVSPERLAALVALVKDGTVSNQAAKRVFGELGATVEAAACAVARTARAWSRWETAEALGRWVDEVLAANPKEVERYRAGETKLIGFFTGQVMKKSGGKADPKKVAPRCSSRSSNGKGEE